MKLIVGLGNPGKKYENNRHNVGHLAVDALRKLPSGVVKKTTVFMNNSGEEVKKIIDYYKIEPEDLYIIHDDLDLKLGEYKIQKGKGPRLHNGVKSIEEALGTDRFWRIRVGVDNRNPSDRTPGEQYVLQDFTGAEQEVIEQVVEKITSELQKMI